MNKQVKAQILLQGKPIFFLTTDNVLYFDKFKVVKVPNNVDTETLMRKLQNDKELTELVDKYLKVSAKVESLTERKKELTKEIDLGILDSLTLKLKLFDSEKECTGVTKDVSRDKYIYAGKNFILTTTETFIDFKCFVERVDKAIAEIDPKAQIEVNHDDESIAIFYNHWIVYITDKFKLNAVLSYLQELIFLGELEMFIAKLKELYKIENLEGDLAELELEIENRIKKIVQELSQ